MTDPCSTDPMLGAAIAHALLPARQAIAQGDHREARDRFERAILGQPWDDQAWDEIKRLAVMKSVLWGWLAHGVPMDILEQFFQDIRGGDRVPIPVNRWNEASLHAWSDMFLADVFRWGERSWTSGDFEMWGLASVTRLMRPSGGVSAEVLDALPEGLSGFHGQELLWALAWTRARSILGSKGRRVTRPCQDALLDLADYRTPVDFVQGAVFQLDHCWPIQALPRSAHGPWLALATLLLSWPASSSGDGSTLQAWCLLESCAPSDRGWDWPPAIQSRLDWARLRRATREPGVQGFEVLGPLAPDRPDPRRF